ncbi:MAG: sodium pump decarboxylase subunit gamma [Kiritimatiellaeota bacterium]|nr:sodium pump decarboxylase subunit gamma [Kiritimatiellota bacterium]
MLWLTDGLQLLLLGMGTVFLFLGIMVACIRGLAVLLRPFAHILPEVAGVQPPPRGSAPGTAVSAGPGPEMLAAVAAAVRRYRSEHVHGRMG